jgi:hypothetical protein
MKGERGFITLFPLKHEVDKVATRKKSKAKRKTYKSVIKGSKQVKPNWKKNFGGWESKEKDLPKRITVENSCWKFE